MAHSDIDAAEPAGNGFILTGPIVPWGASLGREHYVDIVEVTGSIPVAPTSFFNDL